MLGQLQDENKVTTNKMAEQTQIQQVTTKDPKKVEHGKRLAEHNHRKREELTQIKAQSETNIACYGASWSHCSNCSVKYYWLLRLPIQDSCSQTQRDSSPTA